MDFNLGMNGNGGLGSLGSLGGGLGGSLDGGMGGGGLGGMGAGDLPPELRTAFQSLEGLDKRLGKLSVYEFFYLVLEEKTIIFENLRSCNIMSLHNCEKIILFQKNSF